MTAIGLELRHADVAERIVEGIVVPYGETSFLVGDSRGERFRSGSLTHTIQQRGDRVKLYRSHDHNVAVGKPLAWRPTHQAGLWAQFRIAATPAGDKTLTEVREGMLDSFSVGFRTVREARGADGAREIVEAELHEVSLCPIGAYDGARVLTKRSPATVDALEWTTFDRRPTAGRPSVGSDHYWRERRRHERIAERRARPDASVYGTVVPYGVALDDQRGHALVFTPDTNWLLGSSIVPIQLEHGGSLVGVAQLVEERSGLVIGDSTVYAASLTAVGDRRYLSVGLGEYHCRRRADGVLEVTDAELEEISLVRHAGWPDHCAAHIWPKTA